MIPQQFTARHRGLKTYLQDVAKVPTEKIRFGETHGDAKGKVDDIQNYTFTGDPLDPANQFTPLPIDAQLRFSNEYSIHLIIKEFDKELSFFVGQLLFWLAQEHQDEQFDYRVYWDNDKSFNFECWLDIAERGRGTAETGFVLT